MKLSSGGKSFRRSDLPIFGPYEGRKGAIEGEKVGNNAQTKDLHCLLGNNPNDCLI
jgi:hypothetical protein